MVKLQTVAKKRVLPSRATAGPGRQLASVRNRVRRPRPLAISASLSLGELLTVSNFTAAAVGFSVASLGALTVVKRKPAGVRREADLQLKLEEVEKRLTEVEESWKLDREKLKTLEGARAAAVADVKKTLGLKRDADFALKEAKTEIEALKAKLDSLQSGSTQSETKIENGDLESVEELKGSLKEAEAKAKLLTIEVKTVKDFTKKELASMTDDLIKVRDEAKKLREENSTLSEAISELRKKLKESEELEQKVSKSGDVVQIPQSVLEAERWYGYEMRAEAATMVEEMEDKFYDALQKANWKSHSANIKALEETLEAARARDREKQLRKKLESINEELRDKSVYINYLTELLEVLSSKEAQEQAEEQTIKQFDDLFEL